MKQNQKHPSKKACPPSRDTEENHSEKKVAFVYFSLRLLVVATMLAQFFNENYENVFLCLLTLVLFTLPSFFERHLSIELPSTLEIIILLFIFAAEILGEIQAYYITYAHWDLILHTLNGFLCAAVGFSLVDLFNRNKNFSLSLSPTFMSIVAFCFSMTIGVLWEFFELFMDLVMGYDMQKDTIVHGITSVELDPTGSNIPITIDGITDVIVVAHGEMISLGLGGYLDIGLLDTMEDMVVNFVGALVFSILGYFYVKNRKEDGFASGFIPKVLDDEKKSPNKKNNRKN